MNLAKNRLCALFVNNLLKGWEDWDWLGFGLLKSLNLCLKNRKFGQIRALKATILGKAVN